MVPDSQELLGSSSYQENQTQNSKTSGPSQFSAGPIPSPVLATQQPSVISGEVTSSEIQSHASGDSYQVGLESVCTGPPLSSTTESQIQQQNTSQSLQETPRSNQITEEEDFSAVNQNSISEGPHSGAQPVDFTNTTESLPQVFSRDDLESPEPEEVEAEDLVFQTQIPRASSHHSFQNPLEDNNQR